MRKFQISDISRGTKCLEASGLHEGKNNKILKSQEKEFKEKNMHCICINTGNECKETTQPSFSFLLVIDDALSRHCQDTSLIDYLYNNDRRHVYKERSHVALSYSCSLSSKQHSHLSMLVEMLLIKSVSRGLARHF